MIIFEDKLIKLYSEKQQKGENDEEFDKLTELLKKFMNILYNPNNFLTILQNKKEYKCFFITINYDNNIDNIKINHQKTLRFLKYKLNKMSYYNNEYYTKNKKNHYHNHILLFTDIQIYKSLIIQRIERCTYVKKNFIDVKEIKVYKIRNHQINGSFKLEVQNKVKYISGIKSKLKIPYVIQDIKLFKKLDIRYNNIYYNSSVLIDSFINYKNEIYKYYKKHKLYEELYNLLYE